MKIVLQRVSFACVTIDRTVTGRIDKGYVALVGFGAGDDRGKVDKMIDKVHKLRLFPDENGKTNLSIEEAGGGILIVSQFTLYADCKKGNRPSFTDAAKPALAEELYDYFIERAKVRFSEVAHGVFGAYMQVDLQNDGPFTVLLED